MRGLSILAAAVLADRARAILHAPDGLSLPDPDRIDIGAVPDIVTLLEAINVTMPRTAILE